MKFDKTAQQRFTDLYKRYYKLMYHVAFEVLHNRVTTEDVVHTSCVFWSIFRKCPQLTAPKQETLLRSLPNALPLQNVRE